MARSDTVTVEVRWDATRRRWVTKDGKPAGASLGRLRRTLDKSWQIVPSGRLVMDLQKAVAERNYSKARYQSAQHRVDTLMRDLVERWGMAPADAAVLGGISRQAFGQKLRDGEDFTDATTIDIEEDEVA